MCVCVCVCVCVHVCVCALVSVYVCTCVCSCLHLHIELLFLSRRFRAVVVLGRLQVRSEELQKPCLRVGALCGRLRGEGESKGDCTFFPTTQGIGEFVESLVKYH